MITIVWTSYMLTQRTCCRESNTSASCCPASMLRCVQTLHGLSITLAMPISAAGHATAASRPGQCHTDSNVEHRYNRTRSSDRVKPAMFYGLSCHHHEWDLLWKKSPMCEWHNRWQIWHCKLLKLIKPSDVVMSRVHPLQTYKTTEVLGM